MSVNQEVLHVSSWEVYEAPMSAYMGTDGVGQIFRQRCEEMDAYGRPFWSLSSPNTIEGRPCAGPYVYFAIGSPGFRISC